MEDYDIVLLDLLMPEMDGLTVLETVKPYLPQTEFIILTAVDDLSTTVKAIRMGAYDYLVKPVDNELLILTIQRAYERRGLLNSLAPGAAGRAADTPEAAGDYVAGPNHVLPTMGTARIASALGVETFLKKSSIISYSREALLSDADHIRLLARLEGLTAHERSVAVRVEQAGKP